MMDWPWNDRAGRFSTVRLGAVLLVAIPAALLIADALTGGLGSKPVTEATHRTGEWTIRLLLITLAVTPLRLITGWNRWLIVRRFLGVSTFAYGFAHLGLYVVDQGFDVGKAASEIILRPYLTIGFVALSGLAVLAATSTDATIRRLGPRWKRLHQASYGIAVLGLVHFFMQSKLDATDAALMLGLFVLAIGWRIAHKIAPPVGTPLTLGIVAVIAAPLTAGLEAGWYAIATNVPPDAILEANLYFEPWPRPAWWVLAAGLAVALVPVFKSVTMRIAKPA